MSSGRPTNTSAKSWHGCTGSAHSRESSAGTNASSPNKRWPAGPSAQDYDEQVAKVAPRVDADRHERAAWFEAHGSEFIKLAAAKVELRDRDDESRERRIDDIRRDPPAWVTGRVGPRPDDPTARKHWDRAAGHLDDYRHAFGHPPGHELPDRADYRQRHAWEEIHKNAAKALERHPERPVVERPPPQLSHDIGLSIDL
jgi:hypothetical protein